MSLRHSLTAFTLLIVIAFGAVTSLPLIREKISLPTASADPVISIDGSAAHNNIYYIRAGEPSPRTIIVTTNEGKLSYLSIDHLPHGISVTQSSATALQIIVKNVDISDEELPASYGITISATSASGPEELADIIFVIEPRGGQKPFVMFDKPTYQAGETASIIVLDSHVDCNVHELNDGRNPFVEVTVNGPGGFFVDPVRLDRDEFSTNLFRGSLIIDTSGSGQMTVTYPRAVVTPSPCVWPTGIQSAQDQADLSMARIGFNSTIYTTADDTGAIGTTNGVTLTIVDDAAPPDVFATISAGATPGLGAVGDSSVLVEAVRVGGLQVRLTQDPGTNTYRFTGSIESLLNSAGLNKADFNQWPISINATYLDNRPDPDPVAVTTVFATRELSFVVPEGRSFYLSNDTATIELIDPVANSNVNDFNTAMITLCSYNATGGDNRFVIGGKSEIPLLEVGRNTGKFVSGYQLAFINASFNINDIPQDPSDWQPAGQPTAQPVNERELFSQSHIRVLNNQTTQVIAVVGPLANCWPTVPSSLVLKEMIHNSFTVEPSVVSDPDSGGRGQNVGALVHADPPLVTASLINCSLYGGDTDEDGLCNNWETGSGLKVWYPSGSANFYVFTYVNDPYPNPNHKDMLVEIDHVNNANGPAGCSNTVSYKPSSTAIANIKNAFNKGDVTNPDSVRGIKLHIYYTSGGGEEILPSTCVTGISVWYDNPATPGTTNTFDEVKQLYFGSSTERASTDKGKAKWQAFHYCLFIPKQTQDTSSSGVAEQLGNDCVVSLGIGGYFDNSVDEQQGTLMHELGHNLGLYHGGPNVSGNDYNINCKPNYPSVMSYVRQTTNPYSNASLTYSDDKMTSFDVPGNPFISSVDPNEVNVLKLSASSILSSIQIVWGVSSGGTMPPPANIGKTTAADIDWSNAGGINNSNSPPGTGEVNMLGISGCTSGDTVDDKLSGADDWNGIETSGNMNFREKNPDSFATGFQAPQQSETPTQYWALEPNTNTSRQTRAQFINTTNDLVQNIANCSDPAIDSDKASYDVGDEIVITIADGDANQRTNVEDSLEHIRVYSDSDPVGLEFTADETGVSTGVFEFDFDTSGQIENDTNTITVASSDDVTITYTDACSQDVTVPRDFSLIVGIDHVVSTNVTKAILLGPGKMEYEDRLVLNSDSVRMLVLNQSGEASEKVSVEKAIEELKGLRMSLDGFDGGNATDDSFKESQRAVETLKFLTDAIRSLQFALDIPYQKEPFEIKSLGLDCGGIEGCTITGYSDTATSTVENFRIDPDKKRITFHGTGQGDLILQGSTDIMPIKNVQSATTRQDFEFEAVNSTAVLLKDLPYNFKDIAVFYGQDLVAPSSPMLRALNGSSLLQAVNGSDSMISVGLTNYELALNLTDFWRNFTAIIEVRNEDDLTVFLGWQTGLLEPDSFGCVLCKTEVGMSWTPNELGNYKIRTFVLTDFEQPRILSGVKETSIMVVD